MRYPLPLVVEEFLLGGSPTSERRGADVEGQQTVRLDLTRVQEAKRTIVRDPVSIKFRRDCRISYFRGRVRDGTSQA